MAALATVLERISADHQCVHMTAPVKSVTQVNQQLKD